MLSGISKIHVVNMQVYQGMRQMGFAPSNAEFRELTGACAEQAIKEGHGSSLAKKVTVGIRIALHVY